MAARNNLKLLAAFFLCFRTISGVYYFGYSECHYSKSKVKCLGGGYAIHRAGSQLQRFPDLRNSETCLKISDNLIKAFPVDLELYRSVSVLDVSKNRISTLPNNLDALNQLKALDISENLISKLSPTIRFPSTLQSLLISKNRIQILPDSIKIPGLFVLDVSGNQLSGITKGFCMSDQLIRVDYSENPIGTDLAPYVDTLNGCPNANGIPFCLFTDRSLMACDCENLAGILGKPPAFQFGMIEQSKYMTCAEGTSTPEYAKKEIFNVGATDFNSTCASAIVALQNKNGDHKTSDSVVNVRIGPVLMVFSVLFSVL